MGRASVGVKHGGAFLLVLQKGEGFFHIHLVLLQTSWLLVLLRFPLGVLEIRSLFRYLLHLYMGQA